MGRYAVDITSIDEGTQSFEVLGEIDPLDMRKLTDSLSFLRCCRAVEQMKDIVFQNDNALKLCTSEAHLRKHATSSADLDAPITEANSCALNYATSVRTYLEVMHAQLKGRVTDLEYIKGLESVLYDNRLGYRFWYRLRNFIVHRSLPYTGLVSSLDDGFRIVCSRDHLLEWDGWKSLRQDIESLPAEIDLCAMAHEMTQALSALFLHFVGCFGQQIADSTVVLGKIRQAHGVTGQLAYIEAGDRLRMHSGDYMSDINCHLLPERDVMHYLEILRHVPGVSIKEV